MLKTVWKTIAIFVGAIVAFLVGTLLKTRRETAVNHNKLTLDAPILTKDGITFRDLNGNGRLDPYEDPRRPIDERVEDLLSQMTVAEKVGLMYQPMINAGRNGGLTEFPNPFSPVGTSEMVINRHIKHFNIVYSGTPETIAAWYNKLQKMAERTRLGIPVTISSDPRHVADNNPGAGIWMEAFSHWPSPLGLGATRDEALVRQFGDIARQEYVAIGIRTALHPMTDLATEPRWSRMGGTFGEEAELVKRLTAAYIQGFQGEEIGAESVSCMVKHFPGGGPQEDGWDPHFTYGRNQVYPGDAFDYHQIPFEGAFAAGVEQVMPYYGIPVGQTSEDVGMGFNKEIITDLLRKKYGFDGIVCTDWMIFETNKLFGFLKMLDAAAWGVEHLTVPERYKKAIEAGVDQFGGQFTPQHVVELVESGLVSEERIDASVRRILRLKFKLGLFDNPYVDVEAVSRTVGTAEFREAGLAAQRKSVVLLKNEGGTALPLRGRPKLYIENIDPQIAQRYGDVVAKPHQADFAILRLKTPHGRAPGNTILERFFHQGDLDFKGKEKERILKILQAVPSIVDIYLERAAVIPEIAEASVGLLATFGVQDEVLLDAIYGRFNPTGKLPVEMPSSMEAVRAQREDLPFDSENPLFPYGHGLSYEEGA
ncbi:MAG: glycoside hydrolase family 3 N-terminal domain-containing protein [Chloroflexota bacterium]